MRVTVIYVLICALFTTTSCTRKQKPDEILIGEYVSLTGSEATFGVSSDRGVRFAIEERNAKGRLRGRVIRLISYDDQSKSEETASVVKRLVTQDKVLGLIGEVASTRSIFGASVAQKYKVPMITPSATNPKVTEVGEYIFRSCFVDETQGRAMAKFARERLKLKRIAVMKDMKSDFSLGFSEFFEKTFKDLGGEIVLVESYQSEDSDFKAQLTQIRSQNADGLFIPGYYTAASLIAVQARQLGIKSILLGGDGWESERLVELGKEAIVGSYFSTKFTAGNKKDPLVKSFVERFQKRFNEIPDGVAAAGYDAALLMIHALETAKDLSPDGVRDAIAKTTNLSGVTGSTTINSKRDATKPVTVVRVNQNSIDYVETITP